MKQVLVNSFFKTLSVPFSKSYLNRALILGSLNPEVVTIHGNSESSDVKNLIECLKKIGLDIEIQSQNIIIKNSFPECELKTDSLIEINTYDGGTTGRFILPLLSLGKNTYKVLMSERMLERPLDEIFRCLHNLDVKINKDQQGIIIQGPIASSGKITVDCQKTTQEASGLLMAFSGKNIEIKTINDQKSKSYLELTKKMLYERLASDYFPPADFSSIGYPLALAATIGEVTIKNCLDIDETQADSKFIQLLEQLGFPLSFSAEGLKVKKQDHYQGFTIDCSDCLDLVPTLAYLASYADSVSSLKNLSNLKYKESDRLSAILKILTDFEIGHSYDQTKDELIIQGNGKLMTQKNITTVNDHRIVMIGYLFLRKNSGGTIYHEDAVNKSFPQFFEMME